MKDIEVFMYQVSKLRKDISFTAEMFDACNDYIEQTTSRSTRVYFKDNEFYTQLPPNLQLKLVQSVLMSERRALDYFFEDKNGKNKASEHFINEVLT